MNIDDTDQLHRVLKQHYDDYRKCEEQEKRRNNLDQEITEVVKNQHDTSRFSGGTKRQ